MEHGSLIQLVTGIVTKPRFSVNRMPNKKTHKNRWSNFSENLRVVAIKLLELTKFAASNLSIYFHFVGVEVHCDEGDFPCTVH